MRDHELIAVGGAVLEIRSWSKKTPIVPSLFFAPQTPSHVVTVFTDPKLLYLSVIAMQPYLATKAEGQEMRCHRHVVVLKKVSLRSRFRYRVVATWWLMHIYSK